MTLVADMLHQETWLVKWMLTFLVIVIAALSHWIRCQVALIFISMSCMLTFLKATVWPTNNTKWLLEVSQLSHFVFGWCIIENYGIGQWLSSVNAGNASPLIWSIECKWYWVGASVGHGEWPTFSEIMASSKYALIVSGFVQWKLTIGLYICA